jgi:hypothetical protein
MKRWLETKGHALCIWLAVMRVYHGQPWGWLETAWTGIWWRYYCPYPTIDDWTARACFKSGNCGCSSGDRFRSTVRQGERS